MHRGKGRGGHVHSVHSTERKGDWGEGGKADLPPHSFRTSFYLFAAVRVPRGLPNLPQTVFREGSSIFNRQFLLNLNI